MGLTSSYEPLPQDVEDSEKITTSKQPGNERLLFMIVLFLAVLNILLAFTTTLKVSNLFSGILPEITRGDLSSLPRPDPYIGLPLALPIGEDMSATQTIHLYDRSVFSDEERAVLQVLPSGGAVLMRNGAPIITTLTGVIDRIPFDSPNKIEERISGQPIVKIDTNIAMLWTPYDFLINDKVDHIGTDIWSFAKLDGKWVLESSHR
ncbi:hypothetical protein LENED_009859 [Lentinula edodes]|uniref:Uncharacterized protein n=1 Tax=Lentinula edodes TaxID=5353 RepID=A0A1Q3EKW7_LENED|nr:hypothetical protein LENED_009859 [Lentinula edodes]